MGGIGGKSPGGIGGIGGMGQGAGAVARTVRLGEALGLAVDAGLVSAVLDPGAGGVAAQLVEWSVNAGDDPRAALRFGAWVGAGDAALRGVVERFGGPGVAGLRAAVAKEAQGKQGGLEGVGWGFGRDASGGASARFRWWQLAGDDGTAMHAGVVGLVGGDGAEVAAICGGARRCRAVGAEVGADGELVRATVYYSVLRSEVALALLGAIGAVDDARGRVLLAGLCGLDGRFGLPWPKVWVGRSVGVSGSGYKLYVFLRGAERRPSDEALIEMVGGGDAGLAWGAFGGEGLRIPIVGLTWSDDRGERPRWTVYLADR